MRAATEEFPGDADSPAKSVRTRMRIMDAAARVLSRRGYAGARLSDIAAEADVQPSAIYYYFESREDLVEAVLRRGTVEMRSHVSAVLETLPRTATAMERIDAAVEAHLRLSLQLSAYTTAAIRNIGQVPERMRARQLAAESEYATLWRNLLAGAREAGAIDPSVDLRAMRMLILGALNWTAEWWNPEHSSLDSLVQTAKIIIRQGIAARQQIDLMPRFLAPGAG